MQGAGWRWNWVNVTCNIVICNIFHSDKKFCIYLVFPNFFITFVRHSFHTSHPCTSPSRERRHRPAPRLPPGTTLPSWHTRCLTRCTLQRGYAHALRILVSHSTHALHTTTPAKGYATHTHKNAAMLSLAAPSFLRRKSEPPQPKYYILQYYM